MKIQVNGEAHELSGVIPVSELLALLQVDSRKVAVERNGEIVPKSLHGETALADGDVIEIIGFIGGG